MEALTNTAPDCEHAIVTLRLDGDALAVEIRDDGAARGPWLPGVGGSVAAAAGKDDGSVVATCRSFPQCAGNAAVSKAAVRSYTRRASIRQCR